MTPSIPTDSPESGTTGGAATQGTAGGAIRARRRRIILWSMVIGSIGLGLMTWGFADPLIRMADRLFSLVMDRQQLAAWLDAAGPWAPVLFVGLQILQVILAPVPGEVTGVIGGFLFGIWPGFFYSTIGLALGSWINLMIGRVVGERVVRRLIPARYMDRFDGLIDRQGVWSSLLLFVFPGFPKDYLCLVLGISRLPLWVLLLLAGAGRMPGTLLLSIQGGALGNRQWGVLAAVTAVAVAALVFTFRYRARIADWTHQHNRP